MTEIEDKLYRIIAVISDSDLPIMFKGALITKLALSERNFNAVDRRTKDIDANWTEGKPDFGDLYSRVNKFIDSFHKNLKDLKWDSNSSSWIHSEYCYDSPEISFEHDFENVIPHRKNRR